MSEVSDHELLRRFREDGSDEDFTTLVERYVALVHSVALRHTANNHHAEEITQAVFVILARKAGSLGEKVVLAGWLYHTARLTAANFVRSEMRRSLREREALMQSTAEESSPESIWEELSQVLDDAMARLRPIERDALVLRYFNNKSLGEVGTSLGVAERAAQKRVDRALEKLRKLFAKRGITATAAVIATAISTHSVQAAPFGLATKIAVTAVTGSAVTGSTLTLVKGTLNMMSWLKAKAVCLTTAAVITAGTYAAIAHHAHMRHARMGEAEAARFAAEQAVEAERAEQFAKEKVEKEKAEKTLRPWQSQGQKQ